MTVLNDLLTHMGEIARQVCRFIGFPTIPEWLSTAWATVCEYLGRGCRLFTWIFPNENIWHGYLDFLLVSIMCSIALDLTKRGLQLYDKVKP